MKKIVKAGDVVLYKDSEDGRLYGTIITHVTGKSKFKYYRVGQNGFGMIMDDIDSQLKIPAFNTVVKYSFSSIQEVLDCKKVKVKDELLYIIFNYSTHVSEKYEDTLYPLMKQNKMLPEDIYEFYKDSTQEVKNELIKYGFMNVLPYELSHEVLESIESEEVFCDYMMVRNNRGMYFNSDVKLIASKAHNMKNMELKKKIEARMFSISSSFLFDYVDMFQEFSDEFVNFTEMEKSLFVDNLSNDLGHILGVKGECEEIKTIVSILKDNTDFVSYVSENIENYFDSLIQTDREYSLGYYFNILDFVSIEDFKSKVLPEVGVNKILEFEELSSELIDYISKNNLFISKYEDGSDATDMNLSRIASHKNTPSEILEAIIKQDKTTLSGDSYGKWDVLSAMKNPNLNVEFLSKIMIDNENDNAYVLGGLENPNCPSNMIKYFKEKHGEKVMYSTSGWDMVHTF